MQVPFVDLRAQHDELRNEILSTVEEIIDRSTFIGGERVEAFERNFALFCGARHAVTCASGTDALKLALMAVGVRPGDEVITVPNIFIATVEAITMVGAYPVFVLKVIEDACQAHGATYRVNGREKRAGTLGDVAAFSFYPGKNLGAMGEGGAVITNDDQMDQNMRVWRDHGQSQKYIHVSPEGWNARLDALQCAILDIKLKKLTEWNERRREAAKWYRERLSGDNHITLPIEPEDRKHVYHLFVVRLPDREKARQVLTECGVGVGLHYPIPLHLQAAYRHFGWKKGDFPESEAAAASILSLPMFPHITEDQVDYVCQCLLEVLK